VHKIIKKIKDVCYARVKREKLCMTNYEEKKRKKWVSKRNIKKEWHKTLDERDLHRFI